jgi:hypothetical protein
MLEADQEFGRALEDFLKINREKRVSILRQGFDEARQVTLRILQWVPIDERKELLPDLLYLARAVSGYISQFRCVILSLPKDWLLDHIEEAAEPILRKGDDQEYRCLLELYTHIDPELTKKLAQRALASKDPSVREVGQEYLQKLRM